MKRQTLLPLTLGRAEQPILALIGVMVSARDVILSTEGRWSLVSTLLTTMTAVVITALAMHVHSALDVRSPQIETKAVTLPYPIYLRLFGSHAIPAISSTSTDYVPPLTHSSKGLHLPSDHKLTGVTSDTDGPSTAEAQEIASNSGGTIHDALKATSIPDDSQGVVNRLRSMFDPGPDSPPVTIKADTYPDHPTTRIHSAVPRAGQDIGVRPKPQSVSYATDIRTQSLARYRHSRGTIKSSFYQDAVQAGVPTSVVVAMTRIFSFGVDFERDVHPGDRFDVLYQHANERDREQARSASRFSIMEASLTLSGHAHTFYRFQTDDGVAYFDAKGRSARGILIKDPVGAARISSRFGMRYDPVLHYRHIHEGVDFAVPIGTPVKAAGNGTIKFAGRARGYGRFILIKHIDGYSTGYAHLSRFARGIKRGVRVHQGQVVGYSGMSGYATGPHLHFEVRIHNKPVNPLTVKVVAQHLWGRKLHEFLASRAYIQRLLADIPMNRHLASAALGDVSND